MKLNAFKAICVIGTVAACGNAAAQAPSLEMIAESMMTSMGYSAATMAYSGGVTSNASFSGHSFIDQATGAFSYSLDAGQTYQGQTADMAVQASYSATDSSFGLSGGSTTTDKRITFHDGVITWTNKDEQAGRVEYEFPPGVINRLVSNVVLKRNAAGTESTTAVTFDTGASNFTLRGTDKLVGDNLYEYTLYGPDLKLSIRGNVVPDSSGYGRFTMSVTAVPEAPISGMLLAGLGLMGWVRRRTPVQGQKH
jgi:hypothetical protein